MSIACLVTVAIGIAAPSLHSSPWASPGFRPAHVHAAGAHAARRPLLARRSSPRLAVEDTSPVVGVLRDRLRKQLEEDPDIQSLTPTLLSASKSLGVAFVFAVASYLTLPACVRVLTALAVPLDAEGRALAALTGVVMVAVSIVFGTLTSMTANILRSRQLSVRELTYKELAHIDALSHVLAKLFQRDPRRLEKAQSAVFRYCDLLRRQVNDSTMGLSKSRAMIFFAQRAALGSVYGQLASVSDRELMTASFNFSPGVASSDVSRAWDLIGSIGQLQASRSASLEHEFPLAHYVLMVALASLIPLSFCMVLVWAPQGLASSIAMRVLYGMIWAVIASIFNLFMDMADPFNGIYSVQPRRLRVVQAGIVNYLSRASSSEAQSLEEYIGKYSSLWHAHAAGRGACSQGGRGSGREAVC